MSENVFQSSHLLGNVSALTAGLLLLILLSPVILAYMLFARFGLRPGRAM